MNNDYPQGRPESKIFAVKNDVKHENYQLSNM